MKEKLKYLYFCICFIPIYIGVFSVNYLFIIYPLIKIIRRGKLVIKNALVHQYNFALSIILIVSFFVNVFLYPEQEIRAVVSFFLFLIPFFLLYSNLGKNDLLIIENCILIVSIFTALFYIYKFLSLGGNDAGFVLKEEIGSQRFGFIYLTAFFLLLFDQKFYKKILSLIVLIGLLLTFSRASIVALFLPFLIIPILEIKQDIPKFFLSVLKIGLFLLVSILLIKIYIPIIYEFFLERIFMRLSSSSYNLTGSNTSEGIRLIVYKNIIEYVIYSPLFGSGFIGAYIIPDIPVASAHNQYLDVLFRTGLIGFTIYMALLFKVYKRLSDISYKYKYTIVAVLVYGLFHETFKESQGAFLLFFFLSKAFRNG